MSTRQCGGFSGFFFAVEVHDSWRVIFPPPLLLVLFFFVLFFFFGRRRDATHHFVRGLVFFLARAAASPCGFPSSRRLPAALGLTSFRSGRCLVRHPGRVFFSPGGFPSFCKKGGSPSTTWSLSFTSFCVFFPGGAERGQFFAESVVLVVGIFFFANVTRFRPFCRGALFSGRLSRDPGGCSSFVG